MKALLLSGGMDSVSLAWWKKPEVAITVDYGQRPADAEIAAAAAVCGALGIHHQVIRADCSSLGSGDMAGTPASGFAPVPEWWPFRNQMILTLAGMATVGLGVQELMIGTLATDAAHADGTGAFVASISGLMALQEGGLSVTAPALALDAEQLVRVSGVPREILAWAHSCHVGNLACGQCRGCVKHYRTWESLEHDPF